MTAKVVRTLSEDRDHDLLVRLEVGMTDIKNQLTESNQRLTAGIAENKAQIIELEKFKNQFDGAKELFDWTVNLRANLKFVWAVVGILSIPSLIQIVQGIIAIVGILGGN